MARGSGESLILRLGRSGGIQRVSALMVSGGTVRAIDVLSVEKLVVSDAIWLESGQMVSDVTELEAAAEWSGEMLHESDENDEKKRGSERKVRESGKRVRGNGETGRKSDGTRLGSDENSDEVFRAGCWQTSDARLAVHGDLCCFPTHHAPKPAHAPLTNVASGR